MKTTYIVLVGIALMSLMSIGCGKNDPVKSARSNVDRIESNLDGLYGSDPLAVKRIDATRKQISQLRNNLDNIDVSQDPSSDLQESVNPEPEDNRTLFERVTFKPIPEPIPVERTLLQKIIPGGK